MVEVFQYFIVNDGVAKCLFQPKGVLDGAELIVLADEKSYGYVRDLADVDDRWLILGVKFLVDFGFSLGVIELLKALAIGNLSKMNHLLDRG